MPPLTAIVLYLHLPIPFPEKIKHPYIEKVLASADPLSVESTLPIPSFYFLLLALINLVAKRLHAFAGFLSTRPPASPCL